MHPAILRYLGLVLTAVFAATVFVGCDKAEDPKAGGKGAATQPINVSMLSTRLEPLERSVEVVGTLYGDEETTISAKVAGRVTEIFKDVGDRTSEVEPLAQIDPTDYQLQRVQAQMAVEQALAKLGLDRLPDDKFDPAGVATVKQKRLEAANAEARFGRAEKLFLQKPPLISEQDYADQKTTFQVASSAYDVAVLEARALWADARAKQSDLGLAEQRLSDANVKAPRLRLTPQPATQPAKGRFGVAARMVSVGEYVREGTAMFRLVADNPLKYRANVAERFSGQIQVGQSADIWVESHDKPFAGVVTRINPQIDQSNRSFQIEVRVQNDQSLLRPGAFARGAIRTRTDSQVTFAPAKAVVSFAGLNKIFTVKDGKAVEARVGLGVKRGDWIEITSGLKGEQAVVGEGAGKLANGVPVKIDPSASSPATQPAMAKN